MEAQAAYGIFAQKYVSVAKEVATDTEEAKFKGRISRDGPHFHGLRIPVAVYQKRKGLSI